MASVGEQSESGELYDEVLCRNTEIQIGDKEKCKKRNTLCLAALGEQPESGEG